MPSCRVTCTLIAALTLLTARCAPHDPSAVAMPDRPQAAALQQTDAPVARVIVVGDSISAGVGAIGPERSYAGLMMHNDDSHYPAMRGQDLAHRYGAAIHYTNVAHSGDTTTDVLLNQLPRLSAAPQTDHASLAGWPVHGHTVVLMTVGSNDLRAQIGPGGNYTGPALHSALDNLRAIMRFFADRTRFADGVSLYFGNVYDVTDGTGTAYTCLQGLTVPGLPDAVRVWNEAYVQLANDAPPHIQVTLVDTMQLFQGHGFHYDNPQNSYFNADDPSLWLSERDCIHPNHRGHHELRRAFWRALNTAPPGHLQE